jgi:hypothetical protein
VYIPDIWYELFSRLLPFPPDKFWLLFYFRKGGNRIGRAKWYRSPSLIRLVFAIQEAKDCRNNLKYKSNCTVTKGNVGWKLAQGCYQWPVPGMELLDGCNYFTKLLWCTLSNISIILYNTHSSSLLVHTQYHLIQSVISNSDQITLQEPNCCKK